MAGNLWWTVAAGNQRVKQEGPPVTKSPLRTSNFLISFHQASLPEGTASVQKLQKYQALDTWTFGENLQDIYWS